MEQLETASPCQRTPECPKPAHHRGACPGEKRGNSISHPVTRLIQRAGNAAPSALRRGAPAERFMPYETADRPLCGHCGPATRKRAVFFDSTGRGAPLCAMCAAAMTGELYELP